jgi:hypothetical protein
MLIIYQKQINRADFTPGGKKSIIVMDVCPFKPGTDQRPKAAR